MSFEWHQRVTHFMRFAAYLCCRLLLLETISFFGFQAKPATSGYAEFGLVLNRAFQLGTPRYLTSSSIAATAHSASTCHFHLHFSFRFQPITTSCYGSQSLSTFANQVPATMWNHGAGISTLQMPNDLSSM